MRPFTRRIVPGLLLVALFLPGARAAAAEVNLFVASRAFIVSVAPVDEESRNADNSVLYQRRGDDGEWISVGPCQKMTRPDGEVRFTREISVDADGAYQYTSRPVVRDRIISPPDKASTAQAVVIVDTLAPTAEFLAPDENHGVMPGATVGIAWVSSDENLAERPSALFYSTDGGASWNRIAGELPAQGEHLWNAPADLAGAAVLRVTAIDRAGNLGRSARKLVALKRPSRGEPAKPAETVAKKEDDAPPAPEKKDLRDPNRSWLYYLMAINLMRQDKPADALQYYWLSVKEDPGFIDAWADIGLAYIDLGAYKTAREVLTQTRERAPERIDLMHLMGETYHAEGMAGLGSAKLAEDRVRAKGRIDQAVEWYGRALEKAAEEWKVAELAPSFYRLGEICYYVNLDRDGARAYWKKIMELHTPTPNPDLVLWTPKAQRDSAKKRHQRYTYLRVSLDAWQNWARGYLEQLDARERAGIRDLMPAQCIFAGACAPAYAMGGSAINPGRDDGRSLFSLPTQYGTSATVGASSAVAGGMPTVEMTMPAMSRSGTAVEDYSFYGKNTRDDRPNDAVYSGGRKRGGRSVFTGGPDAPPPPNPDPYAFPQRGGTAPWHGAGPYGNQLSRDW